jgi:hypothetical protein
MTGGLVDSLQKHIASAPRPDFLRSPRKLHYTISWDAKPDSPCPSSTCFVSHLVGMGQQFLFGKHSEHGIFFSKAEELISGVLSFSFSIAGLSLSSVSVSRGSVARKALARFNSSGLLIVGHVAIFTANSSFHAAAHKGLETALCGSHPACRLVVHRCVVFPPLSDRFGWASGWLVQKHGWTDLSVLC